MATFTIETPAGRRLTIEADDEAAALAGAQQWHEQNSSAADGVDYQQPSPPPGEIIHGNSRSYISDRPEINAVRDPNASERDAAISMEALKARGKADGGAADTVSREMQPFTQGQSFGFGDELISALFGGAKAAAGGSFRDNFDYAQDFQRQELDRRREEAPLTSLGMEMAGGLTSGMGLAKSGVTLSGRIANNGVRNLLPRVAAGAAEGAGYGAVSGFGSADGGVSDRLNETPDDILMGAIFGAGAVPTVDAAMAWAGQPVVNALTALRNPEQRSIDTIVEAIMRDRTTPDAMAGAVESAARAGQPEFAAIDAGGRNVQRLGAMAAKTPGPFRETAASTAAARQAGQGDRIAGFVDDALGDGSSAFTTEHSLLAGRRAAAQPAYDRAYQAAPPAGTFYDDMLARQSVREAIPNAERVAAENQIPVTDLFIDSPNPAAASDPTAPATIRVPTMRGWDFIKRELDAQVNRLYSAGDTTRAEAVRATRNALRAQLSADNPEYAAALTQYADDSASLEALQTGRDLVNARNPDAAAATFRGLDPGQQTLARVGGSREIGAKLDAMRTPQDKTQLFDTPAMRSKIDTLVDDPIMRFAFGEQLDRERAMVRSNRQMMGGSNTYENFLDGGAVNDGVMSKLAQGRVGAAAMEATGRMLGFIGRTAQGMSADVAERIGTYLLSADPVQIRQLSQAFEAAERDGNAQGRFVSALVAASAAPERSGEGGRFAQ